jgi:hypothetical protein
MTPPLSVCRLVTAVLSFHPRLRPSFFNSSIDRAVFAPVHYPANTGTTEHAQCQDLAIISMPQVYVLLIKTLSL